MTPTETTSAGCIHSWLGAFSRKLGDFMVGQRWLLYIFAHTTHTRSDGVGSKTTICHHHVAAVMILILIMYVSEGTSFLS